MVASQHVIGIIAHALAAKDWTPPVLVAELLFPLPPQATTSPPVLTRTSYT